MGSYESSEKYQLYSISDCGICVYFRTERSTDQVIKPVNLEALSKWVGHIPQDVLDEMDKVAPMLTRLGYDPHANPPNYGQADKLIIQNTLNVKNNEDTWKKKADKVIREGKKTYIYSNKNQKNISDHEEKEMKKRR